MKWIAEQNRLNRSKLEISAENICLGKQLRLNSASMKSKRNNFPKIDSSSEVPIGTTETYYAPLILPFFTVKMQKKNLSKSCLILIE